MTIVHSDRSSRAVQLTDRSFHASYCFESTIGRSFRSYLAFLWKTIPKISTNNLNILSSYPSRIGRGSLSLVIINDLKEIWILILDHVPVSSLD